MEEIKNENLEVENGIEKICDYATSYESEESASMKTVGLVTIGVTGAVALGAYLYNRYKNRSFSNKSKKRKKLRLVEVDENGNIIIPNEDIDETVHEENVTED